MKDFTQIQIEPIPASISFLQNSNQVLSVQNQQLENIILTIILVVLVFSVYRTFKKQQKEIN